MASSASNTNSELDFPGSHLDGGNAGPGPSPSQSSRRNAQQNAARARAVNAASGDRGSVVARTAAARRPTQTQTHTRRNAAPADDPSSVPFGLLLAKKSIDVHVLGAPRQTSTQPSRKIPVHEGKKAAPQPPASPASKKKKTAAKKGGGGSTRAYGGARHPVAHEDKEKIRREFEDLTRQLGGLLGGAARRSGAAKKVKGAAAASRAQRKASPSSPRRQRSVSPPPGGRRKRSA